MFGLGFLAPAFLAGALAVGIPVFLHLFRRRSDRVIDFPAAQLLPQAPVQQHERRSLRDLLLLALGCAALLLLAFSFARPYIMQGAGAVASSITIVAVDTSLSMSAPDSWRAATSAALAAVAAAPVADLVGVVTFDDRGQVGVAPTANRAEARAFIAALQPGSGGTRYATAIGAAVDALGTSRGRVVLVTDLQQHGLASGDALSLPDDVELTVALVPPAPANLAVTGLTRDGDGATAVVQSYAPGPRAVTARLRVAGREVGQVRTELAAFASADVHFAGPLPAVGVAEVTIDDRDGLAGDDHRYLRLDGERSRTLLVLTADPPESARTGIYVQRALEAADDAAMRVSVIDGRRFNAQPAGEAPAAIFVVGTRTLDRTGRSRLTSYLRDGGRVFLTLGPDVDLPSLGETIGLTLRVAPEPVVASGDDATIVAADSRHPVLRRLAGPASSLGRVSIEQYRRLLDESGWSVLARFAGGAVAMGERAVGRGTLLLFASDLDNRWNRFPVQPTFAPFMVETARYLTRDALAASSFVLPVVPPGVPAVPGAHRVPGADGHGERTVVVNVNPAESDPAVTTAAAFTAAVSRVEAPRGSPAVEEARAKEAEQRLWQIGLLVMLGVLVVEGLLGRGSRPRQRVEPGVG
ncbi:MAG: BatA and WFA domain-containing protein [Acidobacteriota bacterium]